MKHDNYIPSRSDIYSSTLDHILLSSTSSSSLTRSISTHPSSIPSSSLRVATKSLDDHTINQPQPWKVSPRIARSRHLLSSRTLEAAAVKRAEDAERRRGEIKGSEGTSRTENENHRSLQSYSFWNWEERWTNSGWRGTGKHAREWKRDEARLIVQISFLNIDGYEMVD